LDLQNYKRKLQIAYASVDRQNLPLWPETIKALKEVPRSGTFVFIGCFIVKEIVLNALV